MSDDNLVVVIDPDTPLDVVIGGDGGTSGDLAAVRRMPKTTSAAQINAYLATYDRWMLPLFTDTDVIDGVIQIPANVRELYSPLDGVLQPALNPAGRVIDTPTATTTTAFIRLVGNPGAFIRLHGIKVPSTVSFGFFATGNTNCDVRVKGADMGRGINVLNDTGGAYGGDFDTFSGIAFLFQGCEDLKLRNIVVRRASTGAGGNHSVACIRCKDVLVEDARVDDSSLFGFSGNLCENITVRGGWFKSSSHEALNFTNSRHGRVTGVSFWLLPGSTDYGTSLYSDDLTGARPGNCSDIIFEDCEFHDSNSPGWASVVGGLAAAAQATNAMPSPDTRNIVRNCRFYNVSRQVNRPDLIGRPEWRCAVQLSKGDVAENNVLFADDGVSSPVYFCAVHAYDGRDRASAASVSGNIPAVVTADYLGELLSFNMLSEVRDSYDAWARGQRTVAVDMGGGDMIAAAGGMVVTQMPVVNDDDEPGEWVGGAYIPGRQVMAFVSRKRGTDTQFAYSADEGATVTAYDTPVMEIEEEVKSLVQTWESMAYCPSLGRVLATASTTIANSGYTFLAWSPSGLPGSWTPVPLNAAEPLGQAIDADGVALLAAGGASGGNWCYSFDRDLRLIRHAMPLSGVKRMAYNPSPGLPLDADNWLMSDRLVMRAALKAGNTLTGKINGLTVGPVTWKGTSDATLAAFRDACLQNPNVRYAAITTAAASTEDDRVLTLYSHFGGECDLSEVEAAGTGAPVVVWKNQEQWRTCHRDPLGAANGTAPGQSPDRFIIFSGAFGSDNLVSVTLNGLTMGPVGFGGTLTWNTVMVANQRFSVTVTGSVSGASVIGPIDYATDSDTTMAVIAAAIQAHADVAEAYVLDRRGSIDNDLMIFVIAEPGATVTLSAAAVTNASGAASLPMVTIRNINTSDGLMVALAGLIQSNQATSLVLIAVDSIASAGSGDDRMITVRAKDNLTIDSLSVTVTGTSPPAVYYEAPIVVTFPLVLASGESFSATVTNTVTGVATAVGPVAFVTSGDATAAAIAAAFAGHGDVATAYAHAVSGADNDVSVVVVPKAGLRLKITGAAVGGIAAKPVAVAQLGQPPRRRLTRRGGITLAVIQGATPKTVLTFSGPIPAGTTFDARVNNTAIAQVANATLTTISQALSATDAIASGVTDYDAGTVTLTWAAAAGADGVGIDGVALSNGVTAMVSVQAVDNAEISYDRQTWEALNIGTSDRLVDVAAMPWAGAWVALSRNGGTFTSEDNAGARYQADSGYRAHVTFDGRHFAHYPGPGAGDWTGLVADPERGLVMAFKTGGSEVAFTRDGVTWTAGEVDAGESHGWTAGFVDPHSGNIVLVGDDGSLARSITTRTDTPRAVITA